MSSIETIIIIVCAILILLSICTPFINVFFRKIHLSEPETDESLLQALPQLSVILFAHDNARELEAHLPVILEQDYPAEYEVIVVEGKSEDDTDDVLKRLKQQYKNLYTTFVPDSARYMSRPKLAITLGVKAAKNEWILITEPSCQPNSEKWLQQMARNCGPDTELIVGYSKYSDEASDYQRFERLFAQRYLLRETQRATAFRTEPGNLMFRKSTFLEGRSFDGNLKYIRGEYDFIVNKFAKKGNTVTETSPKSWVIEDAPAKKQWVNRHLFYMETRKHLKRSFRHRFPILIDQIALHTCFLFILAAIGVSFAIPSLPLIYKWILLGVGILALIIFIIMRTLIARKGIAQVGEKIPAWKIVPFELSLVWRFLYYKIKYRRADRFDFICHKV